MNILWYNQITYLRDLCLRSASSDLILTCFLVDSSKTRCTFSFRQAHPDSTSKPFSSSPLRRSSYMSQRSPNSRDHVNLNSFPPTSITWYKDRPFKANIVKCQNHLKRVATNRASKRVTMQLWMPKSILRKELELEKIQASSIKYNHKCKNRRQTKHPPIPTPKEEQKRKPAKSFETTKPYSQNFGVSLNPQQNKLGLATCILLHHSIIS